MAEKGTVDRPDLEEFLSALSGFVDRRSATPDASYLRFLDIFCRSVGSTEGHLLRPAPSGALESVASFGVDAAFDGEFNARRGIGASPIDNAFTTQKVVAIVEIKAADVPKWFFDLMTRFGYRSLIAVPIVGASGPTGLLCAYYRDVCLFDQGTLDRLLSVGRMLGGAEHSDNAAEAAGPATATAAEAPEESEAGDFAQTLTERAFTKIQVFGHLVAAAGRAFPGTGVVCGPVRMVSGEMMVTVADGTGVPDSAVSHRFSMPPSLRQRLQTGDGPEVLSAGQQGEFRALVKAPQAAFMALPVNWQGKMQAAVIVWRAGAPAFTDHDRRRLGRLAAIAALALNAA